MIVLLLALACHGAPEEVPGAFTLRTEPTLSLPYVSAGDPAPEAELALLTRGASTGRLRIDASGDFAVTGDTGPFEAGEERALTVRFTGSTADPGLFSGGLTLRVDDQTATVALSAVVGEGGLPAARWSEDAWGWRTLVDLPSAPFPDGSAPYDDSSVLVFVPHALSGSGPVGVVTHIHGHNAVVEDIVADQYLVEQLALSGRDAVLIAPQGPVRAADSDFGRLDLSGGHAALVRDALSVAYRDGKIANAELGLQVLSAHSGGYLCVSYILQHGGLDIAAVHLFDALYGQVSVYEDYALGGGLLRSVYTASGGTDSNNVAFRQTLRDAGLRVDSDLDDASLAATDLSVGFADTSHNACTWAGRPYARWLVHSGLPRSPKAAPELESTLSDGEVARVRWRPDRGGGEVVVEGSEDGLSWQVLAQSEVEVEVPAMPFVRLRGPHPDSAASDVYAASSAEWLVVDGFDRVLDGSYHSPAHDFAARVARALGGASSAANEAVAEGAVSLEDYPGVVWLLGDEGTADVTLDEAEQAAIADYLDAGGRLLISGSELGYATDGAWLESTLHLGYVADDAGTNRAGGYTFGVVYDEDYPDVLSGPQTIWSYDSGGAAAVGWNRQLVAVGFGIENLSDPELDAAVAELVGWLDG